MWTHLLARIWSCSTCRWCCAGQRWSTSVKYHLDDKPNTFKPSHLWRAPWPAAGLQMFSSPVCSLHLNSEEPSLAPVWTICSSDLQLGLRHIWLGAGPQSPLLEPQSPVCPPPLPVGRRLVWSSVIGWIKGLNSGSFFSPLKPVLTFYSKAFRWWRGVKDNKYIPEYLFYFLSQARRGIPDRKHHIIFQEFWSVTFPRHLQLARLTVVVQGHIVGGVQEH